MVPVAEHGPALLDALVEIGEQSFFGYVEALDRVAFDERAADVAGWHCAEVDFRGVTDGVVRCALPSALARDLVGTFLGEEAEPETSRVDDMLGELANMICGAWLTRSSRAEIFSLGRPAVAALSGSWTIPSGGYDAMVLAAFNDHPVAVWLRGAP